MGLMAVTHNIMVIAIAELFYRARQLRFSHKKAQKGQRKAIPILCLLCFLVAICLAALLCALGDLGG
jgi:Na+/proline symporter